MAKNRVITREAILSIAKQMFSEYGYEGTDMRHIAAKCDIAVGTLYNYYPNKREIFNGVYQAEMVNVHQKLDAIIAANLSSRERLFLAIEQIYLDTMAHMSLWVNRYILDINDRYLSPQEKDPNSSEYLGMDGSLIRKIEGLIQEIEPAVDPSFAACLSRMLLDSVSTSLIETKMDHEQNRKFLRWLIDCAVRNLPSLQ